ncbi:hypothetical protein B0T14DRAFT_567928 [Immersiella caudata]|uniref:F-box domain-containing protein n=1 Tax=Immersiella caudata TaxID=314043 RepID=A0AA39WJ87_9PEZI|nr:hypothetical protein B0T14DRAFT_567928 [Immersiella caudata]
MDLSSLARELFDKIINHIATDSDTKAFCNLCLVSHQWQDMLSGRIYSKWSYDGGHHSIPELWKFLRSVLSSTRIANGIYEVSIRNWTFGLNHERGRLVLLDDDIDLIRDTIDTTKRQHIDTNVLKTVRKSGPEAIYGLATGKFAKYDHAVC